MTGLPLNNRSQTDILFLDFGKAFDKVSHRKLIIKLKYYGITGHTLGWISGCLSNRTQVVSVNSSLSNSTNVTSGVPQGSVLGPTLFLLYINDIVDSIQSDVHLFADDSMIYRSIPNLTITPYSLI